MVSPGTCVAWFDFADGRTIVSSGGAVSKVWNKSGVSNHLTQGTASRQPITGSRTQNGLNVLDFDGSNHAMVFDLNTAVSQPFTFFIVATVDVTTNQTIIGRQTAATAGQWTIVKNGGFSIFQTYGFGSGGIAGGGVITYNPNANIHTVSLAEGSSVSYQLNNGSVATDGVLISGYNNGVATALMLGASPGYSNFMNGAVAEIIIYNGILNASQKKQICEYLGRKWSITVS